ncbi:MAG: hypothetical protein ACRC1F_00285 [Metamycoplasmataceae bacterium]
MKKSSILKLLVSSSFLALLVPITIVNNPQEKIDFEENNQILRHNEANSSKNSRIADSIIVTNPDILISSNFSQVRDLLETPIMTQEILNKLSITIPASANPRLVSFTNINNDFTRISFTINYNKIPKSTNDFLNITPTDKEIANSIIIEDHEILASSNNNDIKALLETSPMTQAILDQLSVKIPLGIDPAKVSFTEISIDNPIRVTFMIRYNGIAKDSVDYLSSTASDKDIVDKIIVQNNDALIHMTVTEIRSLLETNPMTQDVLDKLSIKVPAGVNISKVSFRRVNISDPFKVTFTINYNNVPKDNPDFLNAVLTDKQTVQSTTVTNVDALAGENINNIKSFLEQSPMTHETLDLLSITIPFRAMPSKYTFTNIDISNPFKITFVINYNGVPKDTPDFLNATPTDKEVVEAIKLTNNDILIDKNVLYIKRLLETPVITQGILDQLSITIPEGASLSLISFSNIDISNLYRVTFRINYNLVAKGQLSFLHATPTDQEVAQATILENQDALLSKNVNYIKGLLETPVMTQAILNELSIKIPQGSTISKFTFTNINIENPFKVTFTINYNGVAKLSSETLNVTPTDQEIAETIVITNNQVFANRSVREIRAILESPLTQENLNLLSIKIFSGVNINRISFTSINIQNPLRVTFLINYNGVPKSKVDFYVAKASDLEIANSLLVTNVNVVSHLTVMQIRDLLEASPMTPEILEQLSITFHEGMDINKIYFSDINIDNLLRVTFRIKYNNVEKSSEDFLNANVSDQDVANRIIVNNPNILKDKNNNFIKALLETQPMTQEILDQLSIVLLDGTDPAKVSFTNINTSNPLRITFTINYNGVPKLIPDFLNTTQSDLEIVNAIRVNNIDAVKSLSVREIRNLIESKPLTAEILNRLSIIVPDGAQINRITFTNIDVSDLFKITFVINYNGVSQSTISTLNATPSDVDVLNILEVFDNDILINEKRENIEAMLRTTPVTIDLLTSLSIINIPAGLDISKISFSNIKISNPFRVTFNITYNGTEKDTLSFFNTIATDLEVVNVINITNPNILILEDTAFIKRILEANQTVETLNQLGIEFPEGADVTKISFTNIDTSDSSKVVFNINYNGVPKPTTDFLNATPGKEIVNAIAIENPDILKSENNNYVVNLLKTNPMTEEVLKQLSIILPIGVPANRISFTEIDTSNLYKVSFRINYNGVPKDTIDTLNTTPTNQDIANSIVITDVDIFNTKDVFFVEKLLKTSPMTREILEQLSINLPEYLDPAKVSFTNINTSNPSKITFIINYDGVPSINELFFNTKPSGMSSDVIIVISILIPLSAVLIAAAVGLYFWKKRKDNSGDGDQNKPEPEIKSIPEPKKVEPKKVKPKKLEGVIKNPEPMKLEIKKVDMNNLDNNIEDEWYGDQVNADWYSAQASAESQSNNYEGYENWYNEQAIDQPFSFQNEQNFQDMSSSELDKQNQNIQYPNQNEEEWIDNRWYSNFAGTGEWSNGNWYEKNPQNSDNNSSYKNAKKQSDDYNDNAYNHDPNVYQDNKANKDNSNQDESKKVPGEWTSMIEMIEK